MATGRGTHTSLAAWGLAGVPILATLIQTTLALLETTLGSAGLGGIQTAIRSIAVFDAAAVLMWQSPAVLGVLFILIAAAWVAQGAAQFSQGNRDVTFAAAGLESVLFFVLFFGVYASMFGMSIPTIQVVGFFAVPFLASGASIGSALGHDWDEEVVEEKSAELAAVSSDLDRKRESFEERHRQRVGDLDGLADVAPTGVERARDQRREFQQECDDVEADVESARGKPPEQLRAETASLRSRVDELDPEAAVDQIDEVLRDRLASGIRTTYGTVQCWSRYDRSYELVNLPGRLREVEISAFDISVHLDRIDDALLDRIEQGVALQSIAAAVAEVDAHVERVEEHVAEREVAFAETAKTAESDVETVKAKVERFDGRVGERLLELTVEGRHDDLPSVRGVEEQLEAGKDALHDCQFDDAERAAADATEDASDLVTLVEFLWSVVGTIDHGGERVSLPTGLDPAPITELRPAFESEYDANFEVTDDAVVLAYHDAPTATGGATAGADGTTAGTDAGSTGASEAGSADPVAESGRSRGVAAGGGDAASRSSERTETGHDETGRTEQARPEEIIDEMLFVFRELKTAAESTDDERAELQTDRLPESVATPAVLAQLQRFGQRQTDVLEQMDVQENAPPGFIELVPKEGVTVRRAVDTLHERYREQYA